MRVIFDDQIFSQQVVGGISRYICALARQFALTPGIDARIVAPLHINQYLRDWYLQGPSYVRGVYIKPIRGTAPLISAINQSFFSLCAGRAKPDLVHETYYSGQSRMSAQTPRILTVYDMIHERFPTDFLSGDPVAENKKKAVSRADHIICISQSTRRDLMELYGVPEEKISVTYLSHDPMPDSSSSDERPPISGPYLLFVGSRGGYKNFDGFLRAFASSGELKTGLRIVCFGGGGLTLAEQALITRCGLAADQVVQLGGSDQQLAALYRGALAFIYPSKYEGFGIPPLEAMSLGCPVLCSDTSSIPEVVGTAGEYFDPDDQESMRHAIESVVGNVQRRIDLIALGHARVKMFSWERCANETLAIYRKICS